MNKNIIAIDIGNSNTKILINMQALQTISNQAILNNNWDGKLTFACHIQEAQFGVCSVISPEQSSKILQKLLNAIPLKHPRVLFISADEILDYSIPAQSKNLKHLGCDRALKIYHLTTLNKSFNHLCFGCGTAFSIEVLVNGEFKDSLITPGLKLQLNSLSSTITQLPQINHLQILDILTKQNFYTTQHSIVYGIINTFCSLIKTLVDKWQVSTITGSGGYAGLIGEYLLANYKLKSAIYINLETKIIQDIIKQNLSMSKNI